MPALFLFQRPRNLPMTATGLGIDYAQIALRPFCSAKSSGKQEVQL